MILGHLPSPTWNRLRMNEGRTQSLPMADADAAAASDKMPEGVTTRTMSAAEAAEYIEKHAPKEEPEKVVAGKAPIYHPQKFATGLGEDFEKHLAAQKEGEVRLLQVQEGVQAGEVSIHLNFACGRHAYVQHLIHLQKGAQMTLLMDCEAGEECAGDEAAAATAGVSVRVILEEDAKLILVRAQLLPETFTHVDDCGAVLGKNAFFKIVHMELGAGKTFVGTQAELIGNGAAFENRAGYLSLGDAQTDLTVNAVQRGRKTKSTIQYEGVLGGKARKILRDTIDFRRGSAGSEGDEQENVLLLSPDAENKSMPVILCEEEDMEGRHGASIGRLDDEMLFYLTTRGLDPQAAQRMMVRAKLLAIARHISNVELYAKIHNFIDNIAV